MWLDLAHPLRLAPVGGRLRADCETCAVTDQHRGSAQGLAAGETQEEIKRRVEELDAQQSSRLMESDEHNAKVNT